MLYKKQNMKVLNKKELISVLQNSKLVREFNDTIVVPKQYVLNDLIITDQTSFNKIMNVLRYYMIDKLPYEIYDYVYKNKQTDITNFKDFFFDELSLLKKTLSPYEVTRLGYINLLICMHKNGHKLCNTALAFAVLNGHVNCVKYIINNRHDFRYTCNDILDCAVVYGGKPEIKRHKDSVNILKYLHESGFKPYRYLYVTAVQVDAFECIKYLHQQKVDFCEEAVEEALKYDRLDCLKYLHQNGRVLKNIYCQFACCGKSINCLKYLHHNDCYYNKQYLLLIIYKLEQSDKSDYQKKKTQTIKNYLESLP